MNGPRGAEMTVLRKVNLPGVRGKARLVRVEYPSGTTQRRMQIGDRLGFDEVDA